jgi:acylphosphatase
MNKEDVRTEIIIHGRVQKAGYKDFIDEIAFNLNINGNVKNLDDGTVQVICEGKENNIKELIEKINVIQYPIHVEKIDSKYMVPTGEFKTFEIIRDKDPTIATYERMDSAARYMREMNANLGSKVDMLRTDTNKNFKELDDKYKLISEGMFAIVNELKDTNRVLGEKLEKTEKNIEKTDKNIEKLLKLLIQQKK